MMCAWEALLMILPVWLRQETDSLGKEKLQELRLRINAPPELVMGNGSQWLCRTVTADDLNFCINAASRYSPWSTATAGQGYLTAPGGHRIGLCGEAVMKDRMVTGIRDITSLCIRVARDFPGIGNALAEVPSSVLILGAPGWGKTTLLRDLAREIAQYETVAVVDERGELFPQDFARGRRMDILTGCPKPEGINMVLRTMGPSCIAVDEITAAEDCSALLRAVGCGVRLLATAHAGSLQEFRNRPVYRGILESGIFKTVVVLRRNKSFIVERMVL